MQDTGSAVAEIAGAATWDARVALIRTVPETFGTSSQPAIYAAVAEALYVPQLTADFAYVHWTADYELDPFMAAYDAASRSTNGFREVSVASLAAVIEQEPGTLRVFRTILGLTTQEFSAATGILAEADDVKEVSTSRVKAMEGDRRARPEEARACALMIDRVMTGELFSQPGLGTRAKLAKPDTIEGWDTVRAAADSGVPYALLLHQRHYGGSFRQLLDATSTRRGDLLEDAVDGLFSQHGVPFLRTGSSNQEEIERRFGVTVRPAPDFVVFDASGTLRAILECKGANDGGTARDKAVRFRALREESQRLGGIPVFAVLSGLGWKRTGDALGPVIQATDGRVFTPETLPEMLTVQPLSDLTDRDD